MFEQSENRLTACHHPFTAPKSGDGGGVNARSCHLLARAYDIVLNGSEIGGGSIRIHSSDMQKAVFNILNMSDEKAEESLGIFLLL